MGGDVREGRCLTQGKGKEHSRTSDHLLQMYPGEILGGDIFYYDATTRVPEVGENTSTSTIQFNTVRIDANSVSHPEEHETETEVNSA